MSEEIIETLYDIFGDNIQEIIVDSTGAKIYSRIVTVIGIGAPIISSISKISQHPAVKTAKIVGRVVRGATPAGMVYELTKESGKQIIIAVLKRKRNDFIISGALVGIGRYACKTSMDDRKMVVKMMPKLLPECVIEKVGLLKFNKILNAPCVILKEKLDL